MSSVLDIVMQQIQAGGIQQMSQSLGLGEDEVTNVVSGAVPALMGSLIRNGGSGDATEVVRHVRARLESSDWQRLIGKL